MYFYNIFSSTHNFITLKKKDNRTILPNRVNLFYFQFSVSFHLVFYTVRSTDAALKNRRTKKKVSDGKLPTTTGASSNSPHIATNFFFFYFFFFFLSWLLRAENLISAKIHQIRLEWPKLLSYHTNIIAKKQKNKTKFLLFFNSPNSKDQMQRHY